MRSNLILFFSSLIFSCLALEIICRVIPLAGSTTFTPESDRPKYYYAFGEEGAVSDYSYPTNKSSEDFRVAVVGDSFTFPTFLQFDDAFSKRLERMLNLNPNAGGGKAEVINFGKMGLSGRQEMARVKKALKYHPDILLLEITLNDPEPGNFHTAMKKNPGRYAFYNLAMFSADYPLLSKSKLLDFVVERISNTKSHGAVIDYYLDIYRDQKLMNDYRNSISRFKADAVESGVKIIAVIFPMFYTEIDTHYPFLEAHQKIQKILEDIQIPFLDLSESYKGIPHERLNVLVGKDTHPNEIAHRIAADSIYIWLENSHIIPEQFLIHRRYAPEARGHQVLQRGATSNQPDHADQ